MNDEEPANYYPAFLSSIAYEMKKRIILNDRIKNDIVYHNVFDGKEAVDKIQEVLGGLDREISLKIGRALESQRFFHDVNYENRLIDDIVELYQFNEFLFQSLNNFKSITNSSNNSSTNNTLFNTTPSSIASTAVTSIYTLDSKEDDEYIRTTSNDQNKNSTSLPIGIFTELTFCYSPTCDHISPCYSYTCPNREKLRTRYQSIDARGTAYTIETQKGQLLWSETVEEYIVQSTPHLERKRQETIFELIYTEQDFLNDLDYIIDMWVEPLRNSDIIPAKRRDEFIDQVFSNITDIRDISRDLTVSLKKRQLNHPIVSQVSDIMGELVNELEPFIFYGARQYRAKYIYEHERCNNPKFALFAEQTERNPKSRKLELNGYLTKPTNRLGKYPLLLDKIYKHTIINHPDKENIPFVIEKIRDILHQVNHAAGTATNQFELEQIQRNLTFKHKKDIIDLRLLDPGRSIIKQGILTKTGNLDSTEYQVIVFDHYLVVTKKKVIHAVDHYIVQKRPIPIELLGSHIPAEIEICSKDTLQKKTVRDFKVGLPILFLHQGRGIEDFHTLYVTDEVNRKAWLEAIKKQKENKISKHPIFKIVDIVKRNEFPIDIKINHITLFDERKQYLLATDNGLYTGLNEKSNVPYKILELSKVKQVHVIEENELLIVLADDVLWQYPLMNEKINNIQHFGRKIRQHVPYFHIGKCLDKTMIFVPKLSKMMKGTEIDIFEATMPQIEYNKRKSILSKLIHPNQILSSNSTQVISLKSIYHPFEVWSIDNTSSLLILSTPFGVSTVNMITKKVQKLLDPQDASLKFVKKYEKIDELLPTKKVVTIFSIFDGSYLICYEKDAFYIDKSGRRIKKEFKIEWEGNPTCFAYYHPYVIAFEEYFIEIREIQHGNLVQIIKEKNIVCLNNGHKLKEPFIFGSMIDKANNLYQQIFKLELTNK